LIRAIIRLLSLTVLAPSARWSETHRKRHKTLTDWARQAILLTKRWLPNRVLIIEPDCAAETARFCPTPDQSSHSPQNEVMCLKFYRSDLNFSCRQAIDAVRAASSSGG
jgi:hypothetical protein